MTFAMTYAAGTISVANGSTAVTGSGVTWTTIREGDSLIDPATGARGIIASIEDTSGALTLLDPWPGTSLTSDPYRIVYDSPARRSGVSVSAAVEELVANQVLLLSRRADYLVTDALLDMPPGSPTVGDVYLIGSSPSAAWSGKAGYLATWTAAAAWAFTAPEAGMRVVDLSVDPPAFYFRGTSAWTIEAVPASGVVAGTYGSATESPVLTIGADGRVTDASTAKTAGKRTITVPAPQFTGFGASAGTVAPAAGFTYPSVNFDSTILEYAVALLPMPKSWDGGSLICKIGWAPSDSNSGGVVWGIQAAITNPADSTNTLALAFGTAQAVASPAPGNANRLQVATPPAVTASGTLAADGVLRLQIVRYPSDASDTYGADAKLMYVQVTYTEDAATDD
ncbi:DUF2793 domain-containing protein [Xanthobacter tagetidis]|uniref:DUF2793 domain-containing protein n=1 Tax=Xanthobacter tagetidis TaxID=60216 RepID=A0A3L7AH32_9HYPH|nr:DUF2793 domain-containing protein [Xanthobacter tagetidis]MBB6306203.1 hypothetical protein [Xanthobacter tagetidis]RLP79487.1 DUF2793 domain-containing protein [Xanthobacter tagetidis]